MPKYPSRKEISRKYASKNYVNKRIEDEKWSRQYIISRDFDAEVVNSTPSYYNLSHSVATSMIDENIFANAPTDTTTDGIRFCSVIYKIDYIRIRLRTATGENETTSAVSQTVRMLLYRSSQDYDDVIANGFNTIVDDVDGSVRYEDLYGNKFGLYWDKWKYVHSWATDTDTTAGGQVFFSKLAIPKFSDEFVADPDVSNPDNIFNEKGTLVLMIIGDDPSGTNAETYGFVEIGWRYKY